MLGSVVTIALGILLMRWRTSIHPERRQSAGEMIYDIAQTNVAEQGLPSKAINRWFPYVASLLLFIFVVNLLGFIPLPLSDETFTLFGVELPTLGIYAATSSLAVTLALALMSWTFTHVEGIRYNGLRGYFASFMPSGMPPFTLEVGDSALAPRTARDPRPVHAADLAVASGSTPTCSPATC